MSRFSLAVHGGASSSRHSRIDFKDHEAGLAEALQKGYRILKKGGSALRAVEAAVIVLEDNPLFNAGRGSVLNAQGEVEMDAAIMDGRTLKAGACAMITRVKNPVVLSRYIMTKTKHLMFSGKGALNLAKEFDLDIESYDYFITDRQLARYQKLAKHGTVGAVALDKKGNLAAATSTGGTSHALPGRIGDSCIIGAGCYANNKTCAVSGTGHGEYLIRHVAAHTIAMLIEHKGMSLQKACDTVIHKRNQPKGEMGVIAMDRKANISFSFNTSIMRRGCIDDDGNLFVKIHK